MEPFVQSECLTPQELQYMMNGILDEKQRLAVAEHLSVCDECLLKYTILLERTSLRQPQKRTVPYLLRKIFRIWKVQSVLAVVMAVVLCMGGMQLACAAQASNQKTTKQIKAASHSLEKREPVEKEGVA